MFTDTVTVYRKVNGVYTREIVKGCMWSDKIVKTIQDGKLQVSKSITITFKPPIVPNLNNFTREDAIFYGVINDEISDIKGHRMSDLLKRHKGGLIKEVNDNLNRPNLKNLKVIL